MGRIAKVRAVSKRVPKYPGRAALEAAVTPLARRVAANTIQRLLGFWVLWHTYGSLSAIVDAGLMKRATVYKARADFVDVFGVNVEDWLPEIAEQLREREKVTHGGR